MIFDYPEPQDERRHGPAGYATVESYRPWLRDEFAFRCAYCLKRETWGQVTSEFELDHFEPRVINPARELDYLNLIYACRRCNAVKGAQAAADPCRLLRANHVATLPDGSLRPFDDDTRRLILQLDQNSPRMLFWRNLLMRNVALAKDREPSLYFMLVGFPEDLPNLAGLRPPQNARKEGIAESWFARRRRGVLPAEY